MPNYLRSAIRGQASYYFGSKLSHTRENQWGILLFLQAWFDLLFIQVPWKFPAVCEVLMHNKMNEIVETGQYCKQNQKHCNSHAKAVLV